VVRPTQRETANLGSDKDAAFTRYHELLAKPAEASQTHHVVVIVDQFLDWCQHHRERRTYDWYKERYQSFICSISSNLLVAQLKPFHVQQWADSHPRWNDGMKPGAMVAVQRAFNGLSSWAIWNSPDRVAEKTVGWQAREHCLGRGI
jgi:hypothetical protein